MHCPRLISVPTFALLGILLLAPWNVRSEALILPSDPHSFRQVLLSVMGLTLRRQGSWVGFRKRRPRFGGYHAIDHQPRESEALKRLRDRRIQPPVDADRQLTEEEKRLLEAWILEGAYAKHWAFQKPDRSTSLIGEMTGMGIIDAFIARQLDARGFPLRLKLPNMCSLAGLP